MFHHAIFISNGKLDPLGIIMEGLDFASSSGLPGVIELGLHTSYREAISAYSVQRLDISGPIVNSLFLAFAKQMFP
jgi:hypothetical protein